MATFDNSPKNNQQASADSLDAASSAFDTTQIIAGPGGVYERTEPEDLAGERALGAQPSVQEIVTTSTYVLSTETIGGLNYRTFGLGSSIAVGAGVIAAELEDPSSDRVADGASAEGQSGLRSFNGDLPHELAEIQPSAYEEEDEAVVEQSRTLKLKGGEVSDVSYATVA